MTTTDIDFAALPPFSGPCPPCSKCGLPEGKAVGTRVSYRRSDGGEYVLRTCGHCGYEWPERCADAAGPLCEKCGGWVRPGKPCEDCAEAKRLFGSGGDD